jgi:hypothetical protein
MMHEPDHRPLTAASQTGNFPNACQQPRAGVPTGEASNVRMGAGDNAVDLSVFKLFPSS